MGCTLIAIYFGYIYLYECNVGNILSNLKGDNLHVI